MAESAQAAGQPTVNSKSQASSDDDTVTLPELFDDAFNLYHFLDKTDESTSSDNVQARLRDGVLKTEKAIRMVNDLDLFSRNEDIDEVSTNEIKFMLLSAFLGHFTGLNTHLPRKDAVTRSKLCYSDFLRLLKSYSVIEYDVGAIGEDDQDESDRTVSVSRRNQDVAVMSAQRNNKIQRFKEKKELERKIAELRPLVEREHVDDEVKREFYISQLKHWANVGIEEVDNCNLELQMLKHREDLKASGAKIQGAAATTKKPKPFRPFILTKTELQKRVFGAGYPSLPTMTVDEFYEQKLKEGTLSEGVQGHSMQDWARNPDKDAADREREEAEKEEKMEREDPEQLARARAMDDWKDDHRRGDGNRHNKG